MGATVTVTCPRGHGPLVAVTLLGRGGARIPAGACRDCAGLWVCASAIE